MELSVRRGLTVPGPFHRPFHVKATWHFDILGEDLGDVWPGMFWVGMCHPGLQSGNPFKKKNAFK